MLEYLLRLDQEVFLLLNNLGSLRWDRLWLFITNKWTSIPLYAGLLYVLYQKLSPHEFFTIIVATILLIACTDQSANFFKNNFQRLRPCNLPFEDRSIANCGKFGFFSAHAASSMALAVFIGNVLKRHYRYIFIGLFFWSLLLGYSRIYVGVHYPGDVFVGFLIGALYGWSFYLLSRLLIKLPLFSKIEKTT